MAPVIQYAYPLILTALGAIVSVPSPYGRDGFMGMWSIHPSVGGDGWTKVRLWVGEPQPGPVTDPGLGGDMPEVQIYNEEGKQLTEVEKLPHKVRPGAHRDYYLKPKAKYSPSTDLAKGSLKRPEYLRISHWGDDPVCIAAIGVQMPPHGREVHIMGDLMHKCGWKTYDSAWSWNFGGREHRPRCFWMGGVGSEFPNNVWLHIPDFDGARTAQLYNDSPQRFCGSEPRLHRLDGAYKSFWPIIFWPPMTYDDDDDDDAGKSDGTTITATTTTTGANATQHDPEKVFNHTNWRWVVDDDKLTKVTLQEQLFRQTRPWKWPKRRGMAAVAATAAAETDVSSKVHARSVEK